jgi:hypothetical protein
VDFYGTGFVRGRIQLPEEESYPWLPSPATSLHVQRLVDPWTLVVQVLYGAEANCWQHEESSPWLPSRATFPSRRETQAKKSPLLLPIPVSNMGHGIVCFFISLFVF